MDGNIEDFTDTAAKKKTQSATGMTKVDCRHIDVFYDDKQAIHDISLEIEDRAVTSFIGPSGCGKSTFLRCINRMNDTIESARVSGEIFMDGANINDPSIDPVLLRSRVGMVFQKPNPFPKSIYDNIAYGPRIHGLASGKAELDEIVENSLRKAGLWEEVKDRLPAPGTGLSGGQQQRLCIARAIAGERPLLLADEPTGNLDPDLSLELMQLFMKINETGTTVLIASHDLILIKRLRKRVLILDSGALIDDYRPQ